MLSCIKHYFYFQYIYHNQEYEKPFFSTYLKTSLFTFYLFGLCLWPPWRDYYTNVDPYKSPSYLLVSEPHDDENFTVEDNSPTSLGEPVFVPVKTPNRETCSEDMHQADCTSDSDDGSIRSVRFNKLAEVNNKFLSCDIYSKIDLHLLEMLYYLS